MAKIYRSVTDKNGLRIEKSSDTLDYQNKTIEKTMTILSGDGDWKNFHGYKVFVDPSGVIIKGPDIFISRKWEDLQRLTFQEGLTVMHSVARATMATNKSFEDEIDKKKRKDEWQNAVKLLTQLIDMRKSLSEKKKARYEFQ
jgi:hypothetical protein